MNRRDFLATPLIVAGDGFGLERTGQRGASSPAAATRPALMKVGTQHGDSDAILRAMAGFGVNHICSRLPSDRLDEQWSVDGLSRLREHVESFGITLDMVPLPMSSNALAKSE